MKPTREDWRWFNEAVETRADHLKGLVVPEEPPPPPPPPRPPVDWLRRGLGIGATILACGIAAALVLWVIIPRPTTINHTAPPPPRTINQIPPPPPPTPQAKVVVDYTRFTYITVGDRAVVTGWQFKSSADTRPSYQYCYVRVPLSASGQTAIYIADTAIGAHAYDKADMAPLTRGDYDDALPRCAWAPGTVLPSPAATPNGADQRQTPGVPPVAAPAPANTMPTTVPVAVPAAVPVSVPPAATAATEPRPMSPAQQAASTTQAYAEGHADRAAWENWFNAQSGNSRLGAEYWARVRSTAHPAPCAAINSDPEFIAGCETARQRLAPVDVRRKTEANYWWGWNTVSATAPAAAPVSVPAIVPTFAPAAVAAVVPTPAMLSKARQIFRDCAGPGMGCEYHFRNVGGSTLACAYYGGNGGFCTQTSLEDVKKVDGTAEDECQNSGPDTIIPHAMTGEANVLNYECVGGHMRREPYSNAFDADGWRFDEWKPLN